MGVGDGVGEKAGVAKPDTTIGLAWADKNSTLNRFGSKEYSPFVCHIMNLFDPRVRECGNECAWVAPFGWVPEAGCSIHDCALEDIEK